MSDEQDQQQHDRDRVIADSGWGIKPDDQPANANEAGEHARSTFEYDPADRNVVRNILQAQRKAFNRANRVVIEPGRTIIIDINGDAFVVEGLSYGDENLIEVLKNVGAAFSPQQLRQAPATETGSREYDCSRVWAWGAERTG